MYGKVVNGDLQPAPKEFVENGKHIRGFTSEFLMERGYKPVQFAVLDFNKNYELSYTETADIIYEVATEVNNAEI